MDTKKRKIVDFDAYRSYFSDPNLWSKLKNVAKKAGVKVVYSALVLYYVTRDPKVPTSEKLKIFGALGYFILPIDLIPDSVIALGFTDDLAALAWAIYAVTEFITPEIEAQAEAKLEADKIITAAKNEIAAEKEAAMAELSSKVADLSVEIAEKILRRELDSSVKQGDYVKDLVKSISLN